VAGRKLNGVGSGPLSGLGDIAPASVDPMERYFRIIRGQVQLPRRGWIVDPQWTQPVVPGMEAFQKVFEEHELPRRWQQAEDFFVLLQRGRFMVKSPNWIEPPITAEMEDLVNETAVVVGTTDTTIITYTVPDRCVTSFKSFGHMLTVSTEWGTVIWNIFVNNRPVRTYQNFTQQRGMVPMPTPFPRPITLKGRDVIRVTARTAGGAVSAFARLAGFTIAAETVTQDGSYKDWNSR
jgi:hypothetical protein